MFGDGTYVRMYFEVEVDRNYRVKVKHFDQKVQMSNADALLHHVTPGSIPEGMLGPSIFYKSVHFQHIGYQDMNKGDEYNMAWNDSLEARPDHVVRLMGANRDEKICVVQFPSAAAFDVQAPTKPLGPPKAGSPLWESRASSPASSAVEGVGCDTARALSPVTPLMARQHVPLRPIACIDHGESRPVGSKDPWGCQACRTCGTKLWKSTAPP